MSVDNINKSDDKFIKFDNQLEIITYIFILPILSLFIFIANLICIIVFIKLLKQRQQQNTNNNKMYFYFLLKSFCDMIIGGVEVWYPLYAANKYHNSYMNIVWYIYFHYYLVYVLALASGSFNIMGSFDCAISINKKMKWTQRKASFACITLSILSFWFISNIYFLLGTGIKKNSIKIDPFNRTIVSYKRARRDFYYSKEYFIFEVTHTAMRDVVIMFVLLIINLYILIEIKKVRKMKQKLANNNKQRVQCAIRAENRKIKMIYSLCFIYVFVHLPMVFLSLSILVDTNSYFSIIFESFCYFMYYSHYIINLFIYFCFNATFKQMVIQLFSMFRMA
jgi:hypothetical protein